MPPDPNGALLEQARLARTATAPVVQQFFIVRHHDIRNELLQGRILLSFGTGDKKVVPWFQKYGEITANLCIQAMKRAKLIK